MSSFIPKTISGISQTVERTVFSAEHARFPGLLQGTDPRAKLAMVILLLLAASTARHLVVVIGVYLVSLLFARLSLLPSSVLLKGVWLGMPLFAAIVALPTVFTMPGRALLTVGTLGDMQIAVSDNGLSSAILLVVRAGTSVSLGLLLVLTTRWTDLLKSLRILHVPDAFIVVFGMTYRYLFLLLHAVNGLFLARASRTVGPIEGREQRRWIASTTGVLVNKSFKMSEDVYQAMVSRGFTGEIKTLAEFRMADRDWLLLGLVVVFVASTMLLDRGLA
ncbi:MAG: cobalt ECF transporter T component CbiQ [Chloroflexi bacterium]|nr:cobalt ECF transporter T component CbiQ [Chloroflexota bacterium]